MRHRYGTAPRIPLPRYNERKGDWFGGDSHTLYAFTDKRTGRVTIRAGNPRGLGIGPEATVRVATRLEAETGWQSPLHPGWRVDEGVRP